MGPGVCGCRLSAQDRFGKRGDFYPSPGQHCRWCDFRIDLIEKSNPFLVSMFGHTRSDDFTTQRIQACFLGHPTAAPMGSILRFLFKGANHRSDIGITDTPVASRTWRVIFNSLQTILRFLTFRQNIHYRFSRRVIF